MTSKHSRNKSGVILGKANLAVYCYQKKSTQFIHVKKAKWDEEWGEA